MDYRWLESKLAEKRVLAVVTLDDSAHAVPLARSLLAGGISAVELTLRTSAAMESIRRMVEEVPEISVGVGTVLRPDQIHEIKRLGAEFAFAPGTNPRVIEAAEAAGIPFVPGIGTASELERAVELGCRVLKLFPSEPLGGTDYLRSLNGPYGFLNLKYVPLGGVNESNLAEYLSFPNVVAVGGSWIAKAGMIREERWDEITENARRAMEIARKEGE